jgi:hypothetical protein
MEAPVDIGWGDIRLSREFDVTSANPTAITLDRDGDHKGQILSSAEIIEDSAGASCPRGVLIAATTNPDAIQLASTSFLRSPLSAIRRSIGDMRTRVSSIVRTRFV